MNKRPTSKKKKSQPASIPTSKYNRFFAFLESSLFTKLIYGWFLLQATFMALTTSFTIPPDETFHYFFIKLFAQNGWSPFLSNEKGYYFLGEVIRSPYFFYNYLLSIPFHVFGSSLHAYIYLRLINILMALGSLFLVSKISKQLGMSKLIKNLSLFMLVNTLMFVFLSASINYDNLFILFTLGSISLLLDLLEKIDLTKFLILLNLLGFGILIKVNFLPVALAIVVTLAWSWRSNLITTLTKVSRTWRVKQRLNVILIAGLLVATVLVTQRFVVNVVAYHSLSPGCTRLHTTSQCSQSALYVRNKMMLDNPPAHRIDGFNYLSQWLVLMTNWTFGILGTRVVYPTVLIRTWIKIFMVLSVVATIKLFDPKNKKIAALLGIILFYVLVLLTDNHQTFAHSGLVGLAVQGRYMFGFLPVIYILANFYILKWLAKDYLKVGYILITLVVFLSASLPSYIALTNKNWYGGPASGISNYLHDSVINVYKKLN